MELIKVLLAGRGNANPAENECAPAAKSTNTSGQIWLLFAVKKKEKKEKSGRQYILHTLVHARVHTRRQICDTRCPDDPRGPYGREQGREKRLAAPWVATAWRPVKAQRSTVLEPLGERWRHLPFASLTSHTS